MPDYFSIEGPVEGVPGALVLRIPLEVGGRYLVDCTRGIGRIEGDCLVVSIPDAMADSLEISAGSQVVVDNEHGKFNIRRSDPSNDEAGSPRPANGDEADDGTGGDDAPPTDAFTQNMASAFDLPEIDAAVAFVSDGETPAPELKVALDRAGSNRWYPVRGGHDVKIPWRYAVSCGAEALFRREKNGWDHEHCDFCDAAVRTGERCWLAEHDEREYLFCKQCYESLKTE